MENHVKIPCSSITIRDAISFHGANPSNHFYIAPPLADYRYAHLSSSPTCRNAHLCSSPTGDWSAVTGCRSLLLPHPPPPSMSHNSKHLTSILPQIHLTSSTNSKRSLCMIEEIDPLLLVAFEPDWTIKAESGIWIIWKPSG